MEEVCYRKRSIRWLTITFQLTCLQLYYATFMSMNPRRHVLVV